MPTFLAKIIYFVQKNPKITHKEIEELSLSQLCRSPENMFYQNWMRGFGKYKGLSRCAYQINRILEKDVFWLSLFGNDTSYDRKSLFQRKKNKLYGLRAAFNVLLYKITEYSNFGHWDFS